MAERYNFRPSCADPDPDCYAPPLPPTCYEECTPCDNPCEPKCPPKVRAHEAICLTDGEWERCFSLFQMVGCEPTRVPAFVYCIELKVRRQGSCRVLSCECPIRADAKGNACFQWSDKFRELPAGYYEADLYINNKTCFTLLFRKQSCWAVMKPETVEYDPLPCDGPERCCVGCVPAPDFDNPPPLGDCLGGCDGPKCE